MQNSFLLSVWVFLSGKIWKSLVYRFKFFSSVQVLCNTSSSTAGRASFFRDTEGSRVAEEDLFHSFASSTQAFLSDRTRDQYTLGGRGGAVGRVCTRR